MESAWAEFRRDLGTALGAWAKAPALPILALAIGFVPTVVIGTMVRHRSGWLMLLSFVICIAIAGWYGTERIWYLRVFRDKPIAASEVVSFSIAFIGPFLCLGLIASLVAIPLIGVAALAGGGNYSSWIHYMFVYIPLDVLLTFMTPALAFTTRRPDKAFNIGLNMLKNEWPRCAGYALAPPLAALVVIQTIPAAGARIALTVAATLLNLWFKGATAAYYLRRHEVPDDGSLTKEELRPAESGAENLQGSGVE